MEALLTRRSIRAGFQDAAIDADIIARVVTCGKHAPSSKDDRPWRLHVVTDRMFLSGIADRMAADPRAERYVPVDPGSDEPRGEFNSSVVASAQVLRTVPVAIAVEHAGSFSESRSHLSSSGASEEALIGFAFEYVGIGAAIENMWICAHALGLAGVFIGDALIVEKFVSQELRLTGDLVGLLALGWSDATPFAEKSESTRSMQTDDYSARVRRRRYALSRSAGSASSGRGSSLM